MCVWAGAHGGQPKAESSVCVVEEKGRASYASLIAVFTCLGKGEIVKDAEALLRGTQQKHRRQCDTFRKGNFYYIRKTKINEKGLTTGVGCPGCM